MVEWNRRGARRKWLDAKKGRGGGILCTVSLPLFLPPSFRHVLATLFHVRPLLLRFGLDLSQASQLTVCTQAYRGENNCGDVEFAPREGIFPPGKWKSRWNYSINDSFDFSTLAYISSRIYETSRGTKSYERRSFRFVRSGRFTRGWVGLVSRLIVNKTPINRVWDNYGFLRFGRKGFN